MPALSPNGKYLAENLGAVRTMHAFDQQATVSRRFGAASERAFAAARSRLLSRAGLTALGFRVLTPPDNGSSIVSMHLERNHARAREVLDKSGVQVSFREKGSLIRVSPALFNTRDEIQRFLAHATTFA